MFKKLIGVFVNMDTMIGKDFETGLANLKVIAESNHLATDPRQGGSSLRYGLASPMSARLTLGSC